MVRKRLWNSTVMTRTGVILLGATSTVLLSANLGGLLFQGGARTELANYGVEPISVVDLPSVTVLVITLFAILMLIDGERRGYRGAELAVGVLAIGAFVLGYQQWLDGRREVSLDKYYERLDGADQRLASWPAAQSMLRHFWNGGTDQDAFQRYDYVYVELDNLEYVLEKYKLGYVDARHAWRAVATFASRCQSPEFRDVMMTIARIDAGYQKTTMSVAARVCSCSVKQ